MEHRSLGRTDIMVSRLGLGTMTFGAQNTEAEAFTLLDSAAAAGINFLDVAEMYPFPMTEKSFGATETIVGNWMKARGNRDRMVVATKIIGPGARFDFVRDGDGKHSRANLETAVEASLRRLGTDTIDLYYLHWPERPTNYFGRLGYVHDPEPFTPLEGILAVMAELIKAGKVRAFGVSNETAWGLMKYLSLAEAEGLPRVAGIQNPYSLLNRTFEVGLAEVAAREDCGLMAHSPLAFGALTAKYLDGRRPDGARYTLYPEFGRYFQPRCVAATEAYAGLARDHGLDPAQMALAYVASRPFVTSTLIGARSLEQLTTNLGSLDLELPADVVDGIEAIHRDNPNPAP